MGVGVGVGVGVGGVNFPGKKRYEVVRFKVISITRRWVGVKFPGKKRYVTLEWPLCRPQHNYMHPIQLFLLRMSRCPKSCENRMSQTVNCQ